ncbi:MAG: hypothetical protein LBO08_00710 [Rickettsiales bacterium]|jgi:hypothetical protein|nr:hypothetical protein [Rickettsiales bacterium]
MKKIVMTSLVAVFAASAANAGVGVLDANYRVGANQFSAGVNLELYKTGLARDKDEVQTYSSFGGGSFVNWSAEPIAYGITKELAVSLKPANGALGAGVDYRVYNSNAIAVDVLVDGALSLTKFIDKYNETKFPVGQNSVSGGLKLSGALDKLAYKVQGAYKYNFEQDITVFDDNYTLAASNVISLSAQVQYQVVDKWAVALFGGYDITSYPGENKVELTAVNAITGILSGFVFIKDAGSAKDVKFNTGYIALGGIYTLSDNAQIMPYVLYQLNTDIYVDGKKEYLGNKKDSDASITLGAKFGIQF